MPRPLGERKVHCQDCAWTGTEADTGEIDDFFERVDTTAGSIEIMPCGECPECGCLSAIDDEDLPSPAAEFEARHDALRLLASIAIEPCGSNSEPDRMGEALDDIVSRAQAFFKAHGSLKITDYVDE